MNRKPAKAFKQSVRCYQTLWNYILFSAGRRRCWTQDWDHAGAKRRTAAAQSVRTERLPRSGAPRSRSPRRPQYPGYSHLTGWSSPSHHYHSVLPGEACTYLFSRVTSWAQVQCRTISATIAWKCFDTQIYSYSESSIGKITHYGTDSQFLLVLPNVLNLWAQYLTAMSDFSQAFHFSVFEALYI